MSERSSVESADLTYQRNLDVILNRAKDYENDKKRFREQARDKHLNLYGEEKKRERVWEELISQYV